MKINETLDLKLLAQGPKASPLSGKREQGWRGQGSMSECRRGGMGKLVCWVRGCAGS